MNTGAKSQLTCWLEAAWIHKRQIKPQISEESQRNRAKLQEKAILVRSYVFKLKQDETQTH